MSNKVFVHIHAKPSLSSVKTGGFKMLVQLTDELCKMGYDTSVFDHQDNLTSRCFDWLCWESAYPRISSFSEVRDSDAPIVTSWIGPLIDQVGELIGGIEPGRIRYWCQSELIRVGKDSARKFVSRHCERIAVNNWSWRHLYDWYHGAVIRMENWVRDDLFYYAPDEKRPGLIGTQVDGNDDSVYRMLVKRFGNRVILCNGTQSDVAKAMREAELYVFYAPKRSVIEHMDRPCCALNLIEAMACGCLCFTVKHIDNAFVGLSLIRKDTWGDVLDSLALTVLSEQRLEHTLAAAREYRWNDQRTGAVEVLLR
jgi:hypothetical protein